MKVDDLRHGSHVKFTADSGLDPSETYTIHSIDTTAWAVRVEGKMGSFSLDHVVGLDISPTVPAGETGTIGRGAIPSGLQRDLSTPASAPKVPGDEEPNTPNGSATVSPSVLGMFKGINTAELLGLLEHHLTELVAHPDGIVRHHAKNALVIFWLLEGEQESEEHPKEEQEKDAQTQEP